MKKWFHSLTRQGKMMLLLIVLLLIGVILRWDNIRQKAGIWFRYDDIMEQRADSLRQATGLEKEEAEQSKNPNMENIETDNFSEIHSLFIRKYRLNQRYGLCKAKSETSLPRSCFVFAFVILCSH